jgi:hypothetical protein
MVNNGDTRIDLEHAEVPTIFSVWGFEVFSLLTLPFFIELSFRGGLYQISVLFQK